MKKKLKLNKDTLLLLEDGALVGVAGGAVVAGSAACSTLCSYFGCDPDPDSTVCPGTGQCPTRGTCPNDTGSACPQGPTLYGCPAPQDP